MEAFFSLIRELFISISTFQSPLVNILFVVLVISNFNRLNYQQKNLHNKLDELNNFLKDRQD